MAERKASEAVPHTLPEELKARTAGGTWAQVTIGRSGHEVYRVAWPDERPALYVKIAGQAEDGELLAEAARLRWLSGRLPVPEVVLPRSWAGRTYLALTEVPGVMACDPTLKTDVEMAVRLLAEGLRRVHAVEVAACPFDERLTAKLARAAERVRAGRVDEDDFDDERQGMSANAVYEEALLRRPASEDLVFTHGDYCLPNVLVDVASGRVNGFIDLGRAGVADRYQDLALAARSLAFNWGPGWEPLLWEAYGLAEPDREKLAYYMLLDELF